jgi:hypothetical protein
MPNHVESDLFIRGDAEELKRFIFGLKINQEDGESASILRSYCPMPEELIKTNSPIYIISEEEYLEQKPEIADDAFFRWGITKEIQQQFMGKYGCDNWYDWAEKYWGSKWGDYDLVIDEFDEEELYELILHFRSAWGVPETGLNYIFSLFPLLKFSLYSYEQGCGFQEGREYEDGIMTEYWTHAYHGNRGG